MCLTGFRLVCRKGKWRNLEHSVVIGHTEKFNKQISLEGPEA